MYLIVYRFWDPDADTSIDHWIQSIKSRVSNAPVIIVGTHLSDPAHKGEDVEQRLSFIKGKFTKLYRQYFKTMAFVVVDGVSMERIDDFRMLLQEIMMNQNFMGENLPYCYTLFEQVLEEYAKSLKVPVLEFNQFQRLANTAGLDNDIIKDCAHYLYEVGAITYFKDDKALSHLVILSPDWLIDVMRSLFTTKHTWAKNGVLQHANLSHIWKEYSPDIHSMLLYLLEKFEILLHVEGDAKQDILACVGIERKNIKESLELELAPGLNLFLAEETQEIIDDGLQAPELDLDGVSIIPSLLPKSSIVDLYWPKHVDPEIFHLDRIFRFNFVPTGLLSRLMIRILAKTKHVTAIWESGISGSYQYGYDSEGVVNFLLIQKFSGGVHLVKTSNFRISIYTFKPEAHLGNMYNAGSILCYHYITI